MNTKKAFTLVELLAVITILGVILLLVYPIIKTTTDKSKEKLYRDQVVRIEESAKRWSLDMIGELPSNQNEAGYVTIFELQSGGYLPKDNILDPLTNNAMDGCVKITYDQVNDQYQFSYIKICEKTKPTIVVENGKDQRAEVNSIFTLPKVEARDTKGKPISLAAPTITKNGTAVSTVTTNQIGSLFLLTYKATDPYTKEVASFVITVQIVDTQKPVITVLGNTSDMMVVIREKTVYPIPTATVTDNSGEKVTATIVKNNLNTNVAGTYQIQYKAVDSSKNAALLTLTIQVTADGPSIVLNGNKTIDLYVNESYTDEGANATNSLGEKTGFTITYQKDGQPTSSINTAVAGQYLITYTVTDGSKTASVTRTVNVKPRIVITWEGTSKVDLDLSLTSFNPLDRITAKSNGTTDVTSSIAVKQNTVSLGLAGTYKIVYKIIDEYGTESNFERTVKIADNKTDFTYTGGTKTYAIPFDAEYQIQLWGASGANSEDYGGIGIGGKGAYTSGKSIFTKGTTLYFNVGGTGAVVAGGYNGGGTGGQRGYPSYPSGGGGGGATDVRLTGGAWNEITSLRSRLMVAAGGGGGGSISGGWNGGCGGALTGCIGSGRSMTVAGGSQTGGYSFGTGQTGVNGNGAVSWGEAGRGGGGGGYYGGYASQVVAHGTTGGGGGSSFISGLSGCNAINTSGGHTGQPNHFSGTIFSEPVMKSGNEVMPTAAGSTMTGNTGNGYARIIQLIRYYD